MPEIADNLWAKWARERTGEIAQQGRWRTVRDFRSMGQVGQWDGAEVVSFASNDYLGLSHHPAVVESATRALQRWGAGSGSSRLVVGSRPIHSELEEGLAEWKSTQRCVVFPTGYSANLGVLSCLGGPGVTIFSDELNHASIVDGCRLSRSAVSVYPHLDTPALETALANCREGRKLIVSDAVFSMDGDIADVATLTRLAEHHDALLVLDEAHSVFGTDSGATTDADAEMIVHVGTLSKTLGAQGGFAACSRSVAELIVNTARPFIFTTALSPADCGAALGALRILHSLEGRELISRLEGHVDVMNPGHPSPIIPVVVGTEDDALAASASLVKRGILVPAIRPPTVPEGTSRLRVSLSADHTGEQVRNLLDALREAALWP